MKSFLKAVRRAIVSKVVHACSRSCKVNSYSSVVIATHPDDESFALGGLLALKCACRAQVDLVFLTSGEASHNDCCRTDQAKLGEARRAQARSAVSVLGITEDHMYWLTMRDGYIPAQEGAEFSAAVEHIAGILRKIEPAEIFCPHPLDCWQDHEAASRIVLAAVKLAGRPVTVRFYLVWGWYSLSLRQLTKLGRANRIDVSSVQQTKLTAIDRYIKSGPAGCIHPYVGAFPRGFLDPFRQSSEFVFDYAERLFG